MTEDGYHKYDDIINMQYPPEDEDRSRHPRMSAADRAKIFSPFAALKGYEEAIADRQEKHTALGEPVYEDPDKYEKEMYLMYYENPE